MIEVPSYNVLESITVHHKNNINEAFFPSQSQRIYCSHNYIKFGKQLAKSARDSWKQLSFTVIQSSGRKVAQLKINKNELCTPNDIIDTRPKHAVTASRAPGNAYSPDSNTAMMDQPTMNCFSVLNLSLAVSLCYLADKARPSHIEKIPSTCTTKNSIVTLSRTSSLL